MSQPAPTTPPPPPGPKVLGTDPISNPDPPTNPNPQPGGGRQLCRG